MWPTPPPLYRKFLSKPLDGAMEVQSWYYLVEEYYRICSSDTWFYIEVYRYLPYCYIIFYCMKMYDILYTRLFQSKCTICICNITHTHTHTIKSVLYYYTFIYKYNLQETVAISKRLTAAVVVRLKSMRMTPNKIDDVIKRARSDVWRW